MLNETNGVAGQTMAGWFVCAADNALLMAAVADFQAKVETQLGIFPQAEAAEDFVEIDLEFMIIHPELSTEEFNWLQSWSQKWNIKIE